MPAHGEHERPLVELKRARFSAGGRDILRDLDWALLPGQHWAVVGANGAGKSTFLKLVRGDLWPSNQPEARLYRHNGSARPSPIGFREHTGLISPDLLDVYRRRGWSLAGGEVVLSGLFDAPMLYRDPTPAQKAEAERVMSGLGIGDLAEKPLLELSQGQAMKCLLARALMGRPRLLLLDEFSTGLDRASRSRVDRALAAAADRGCQVIMATHRPEDLFDFMSHAMVLDQGRIARQGPLAEVLDSGPAATAVDPAATGSGRSAGTGRGFVFRLKNVDVYREGRPVLRGIDWTVRPGQAWSLSGDNGAGKSTLLGLLAGDHQPALGGTLERFGSRERLSLEEIRARVGVVSAEFQARHAMPQSVRDTVLSGFQGSIGLHRPPTPRESEAAADVLQGMGLASWAERPIHALSYGQLRRVMIARALVNDPGALLLDEPLQGLDAPSRQAVSATLEQLIGSGVTLIMATHQPEDLPASLTHRARLERGRLIIENE